MAHEKKRPKFHINHSKDGQFYVTLKAANGETVHVSETYKKKDTCHAHILRMRDMVERATVEDETLSLSEGITPKVLEKLGFKWVNLKRAWVNKEHPSINLTESTSLEDTKYTVSFSSVGTLNVRSNKVATVGGIVKFATMYGITIKY